MRRKTAPQSAGALMNKYRQKATWLRQQRELRSRTNKETDMAMETCKTPDQCNWQKTQHRDSYGIRSVLLTCTTCGRARWRTEQAPRLGDNHRRMD